MITAIASATAKEKIIDKNIRVDAEGLRPKALIDSNPTKAITNKGPATPMNNAITAIITITFSPLFTNSRPVNKSA